MYRIGEFSKLTNLSIRTLRFYDEIGLLVPEEVDVFTSYRYYGEKNLEQIKLISELKKAGFSLEEIKDNWDNFTNEKLNEKKQKLYQKLGDVQDEIKQLDKLRSYLNNGTFKLKNQETSNIRIKEIRRNL